MAPIRTKLCQNAFQTIPVNSIFGEKKFVSARFFGLGNRFSPCWAGFEASSEKWTSKSTSSQFFALDGPILSSVRPKIIENVSVGDLRSAMLYELTSNHPIVQILHLSHRQVVVVAVAVVAVVVVVVACTWTEAQGPPWASEQREKDP